MLRYPALRTNEKDEDVQVLIRAYIRGRDRAEVSRGLVRLRQRPFYRSRVSHACNKILLSLGGCFLCQCLNVFILVVTHIHYI